MGDVFEAVNFFCSSISQAHYDAIERLGSVSYRSSVERSRFENF